MEGDREYCERGVGERERVRDWRPSSIAIGSLAAMEAIVVARPEWLQASGIECNSLRGKDSRIRWGRLLNVAE